MGQFIFSQLRNQIFKLHKLPKAPPSKTGNSSNRPGRPREFDHDVVLDKVMETFWAHGYDATSVSLLESKTGLAAPSLYAAFGNKQQLFQKSVEHYRELTKPIHYNARKQPRSWLVAKHLLEGLVEFFTTVGNPKGCLVVLGAVSSGTSSDAISNYLVGIRSKMVVDYAVRFERSIKEGDLPADTDPYALANYLITLDCGLALQSKVGYTKADLLKVVSLALENWPGRDQ